MDDARPPPRVALLDHFSTLEDHRIDRTKKHSMTDILVIAICGFICGVDNWVDLEEFGEMKRDWFETFLELPNGIPSHDTFGRFFAALDPEELSRCFTLWVKFIAEVTEGEVVATDGKTLRRSFDRASSKAAIHMAGAWASKNNLVLGQVKTEEKSNEITAIPKLLEILHLQGSIVTIDAIGCQKDIVERIIGKGADYVISLKGNQGNCRRRPRRSLFREAREENFETVHRQYSETLEKDHGRVERRRHWVNSKLDWFREKDEWAGLTSVGMVESHRTIDDKTSVEVRYFISSLAGDDAEKFAAAVRKRWTVENNLHWVLDVAFDEDQSRVRKNNAAENMALLRHLALNLLKGDTTTGRHQDAPEEGRLGPRLPGPPSLVFLVLASRVVPAGRPARPAEPRATHAREAGWSGGQTGLTIRPLRRLRAASRPRHHRPRPPIEAVAPVEAGGRGRRLLGS